jgi:hypothetical protein
MTCERERERERERECVRVCVCVDLLAAGVLYGVFRDIYTGQLVNLGWTVRGSNTGGGEIFRTRPDRLWGPPSLLYKGYRFFTVSKTAGAWS